MFLMLPLVVFGLSLAGFWVIIGVGIAVIILLLFIGIVNVLQKRRPMWLPTILRDWTFLPLPLRSLEPYDRVVSACLCCKKGESTTKGCCCCKSEVGTLSSTDSNTSFTGESSSNGSTDCVRITPLQDRAVYDEIDLGKSNEAYENDSQVRNSL